MNQRIKRYSSSFFPLGMACILVIFSLLYRPFGLPSPEDIAVTLEILFNKYGISILFVGAFIESIFMVNLYFPGSFVIFLAILFSTKDLLNLLPIVLVVWAAFLLGNCLNYFLGRYGFYRALFAIGGRGAVGGMEEWMRKRGNKAVLIAGVHPNLLAITMVCFGIARNGFWKSVGASALSTAIWVPILTIVTAILFDSLGPASSNFHWIIIFVFLIWGLISVLKVHAKND